MYPANRIFATEFRTIYYFPMPKRALYIGRFQPIHFGHLNAIQQIFEHSEGFDEILIVIGSAEKAFLPKDPLTTGERFELILRALEEAKVPREKIWIFSIRNIDRYSLWPYYVKQLCPEFDAIFSGSPLIHMLWEEAFPDKSIQVFPLKKELKISASEIRKKVKEGKSIRDMVPKSVQEYLEDKIKLRKRLLNMKTK